MSNKDNISAEEKNSALTPAQIISALNALPRAYLASAKKILDEKHRKGEISKTYTENWISQVKNGKKYNEDVLTVLVELGTAQPESPFAFLRGKNKKAPAET